MNDMKLKEIAKLWVKLGGNDFDVTLKWIKLRELVNQIQQKEAKT